MGRTTRYPSDLLITPPTNETTQPMFISPIPFWGTIMISIAGCALLLIVLFCCVLFCLCRRSNKKKKFAGKPVGLTDNFDSMKTKSALMQPGLDELPEKYLGTLYYTLDYNLTKNMLYVGVIKIEDLPGSLFSKPSSTFVRVRLHPELRTYETKVINLTRNPVFQETFSFPMPPDKQATSTVMFSVYDHQMFTKHKKMSQLHLPLKTLILSDLVEDFATLEEPVITEEETGIGDICLSLKFVASQCKLHVVVIEAKALHKWSPDLKDPYVKLYLMMNKKILKKKKTTTNTATDINPYYNESFEFNVTSEDIRLCSLRIRVSYKKSLGRSNHVGEITLDLEKTGTGYKHWLDIINTPGQPFAMWHSLIKCDT